MSKNPHTEKMSFGQSPKSNKGKYTEKMSFGPRSTKINFNNNIDEWVEEEFVVKQQDKE